MEKMEILVKTIREWKIISVKRRKTHKNQRFHEEKRWENIDVLMI
jgi:hypothetical protein